MPHELPEYVGGARHLGVHAHADADARAHQPHARPHARAHQPYAGALPRAVRFARGVDAQWEWERALGERSSLTTLVPTNMGESNPSMPII